MSDSATRTSDRSDIDVQLTGITFLLADFPKFATDVPLTLRSDAFRDLMDGSVRITNSMAPDPIQGFGSMFAVEAPRNPRTVAISQSRVEVVDRSGDVGDDGASLADFAKKVVDILGASSFKAIGSNIEAVIREHEFDGSGLGIAQRLFHPRVSSEVAAARVIGASTRIFLTSSDADVERTHSIAIEPRWQDVGSSEIWVTSNVSVDLAVMPSDRFLTELCAAGHKVVFQLLENAKFIEGIS